MRHSKHLADDNRNGQHIDIVQHFALGLVGAYNLLPEFVVAQTTVSVFFEGTAGLGEGTGRQGCRRLAGLADSTETLARWRNWAALRALPPTELTGRPRTLTHHRRPPAKHRV